MPKPDKKLRMYILMFKNSCLYALLGRADILLKNSLCPTVAPCARKNARCLSDTGVLLVVINGALVCVLGWRASEVVHAFAWCWGVKAPLHGAG